MTTNTCPAYVAALESRVARLEYTLRGPDKIILPPGVTCTPKVEALLRAILAGQGQPVSTSRLHDALYGMDKSSTANISAIKVTIGKLRAKLAGVCVITSQVGKGYSVSEADFTKFMGKEPWQ